MKTILATLALTLSFNSFASTVIPGNATGIKLAFAQKTKIDTEFRSVPCSLPDTDLENCQWPTASKEVVAVTVEYTSGMSEETQIVQNFDASEFSEADLAALSSKKASVRMTAARSLFAVNVKSEVRVITHQVCQADSSLDCANGRNSYTETYNALVKLVDIVRK